MAGLHIASSVEVDVEMLSCSLYSQTGLRAISADSREFVKRWRCGLATVSQVLLLGLA